MKSIPHILEFTCVLPTTSYEKIGDNFTLGKQEYYWNSDGNHGRGLLFFLDHPDNYRVSKIKENGHNYVIPENRVKHHFQFLNDGKTPDFNELIKLKTILKNKIDHLNHDQVIDMLSDLENEKPF